MSDNDINEIFKYHFKNNKPKSECYSLDTLSDFANGKLSKEKSDAVAEHMAYCSTCRRIFTNLSVARKKNKVKKLVITSITAAASIFVALGAYLYTSSHKNVVAANDKHSSVFSFAGGNEVSVIPVKIGIMVRQAEKGDESADAKIETYVTKLKDSGTCEVTFKGEYSFDNAISDKKECETLFKIGYYSESISDDNTNQYATDNKEAICSVLPYAADDPLSTLTEDLNSKICNGKPAKADEIRESANKIITYVQD